MDNSFHFYTLYIDEECTFQNIYIILILFYFDMDKYYISSNNANKRVTYLRDISL